MMLILLIKNCGLNLPSPLMTHSINRRKFLKVISSSNLKIKILVSLGLGGMSEDLQILPLGTLLQKLRHNHKKYWKK